MHVHCGPNSCLLWLPVPAETLMGCVCNYCTVFKKVTGMVPGLYGTASASYIYPSISNHNVLSQDTQNWLVSWTVSSDTVNTPRGKKFHWYFCRQTCIMFMGRQTWPQKSERCAEERRVLPGTGSIHLGEEPVNVGFESVKKKPFCWMQQIILPGSVEVSRKVQRPAQRKANSLRPCLLRQ